MWTLKIPVEAIGSQVQRDEIGFDGPPGAVPAPLVQAVLAYTRGQPLVDVIRLRTTRVTFDIDVDGRRIATLSDDTVVAGGLADDTLRTFREIEIELAADRADVDADERPDPVDAVLARLNEAGFEASDVPVGKALRALGPLAFEAPDVTVPNAGKRSPLAVVVRRAIARSVVQMIGNHAGVCTHDPESLHQFRVAGRRLRSDLRTFEPLLEPAWTKSLRDELGWLGGEVGAGRDADVFAENLRSALTRLDVPDPNATAALLQRLDHTVGEAHGRVTKVLSSDRYVSLLDALVHAAAEPRFSAPELERSDAKRRRTGRRLVKKPWRHLERAVEALAPDSPDSALHRVRILSKRARYAAEAVAPLNGGAAKRFADGIAKVQTVLGSHHDSAVAEMWLCDAATAVPETRALVDELLIVERDGRARLRDEFDDLWKVVSRPKRRRWLQ